VCEKPRFGSLPFAMVSPCYTILVQKRLLLHHSVRTPLFRRLIHAGCCGSCTVGRGFYFPAAVGVLVQSPPNLVRDTVRV